MSEMQILVRQRPGSAPEEPRMGTSLVHMLAWVLGIRRRVLERHGLSPAPGAVVILGKYYKEAYELLLTDMTKVIRLVKRGEGECKALANPWDEEEAINAAVAEFADPNLLPTREQVRSATRGSQIKTSFIITTSSCITTIITGSGVVASPSSVPGLLGLSHCITSFGMAVVREISRFLEA